MTKIYPVKKGSLYNIIGMVFALIHILHLTPKFVEKIYADCQRC